MTATFKKMITPFGVVGDKVTAGIFATHIAVLLIVWTFLVPEHSFFPNLVEVLGAWRELWKHGLFFHIFATLKLCGAATVISILISCTVAYASTIPAFSPISQFFSKLRFNPIQGFTIFFTSVTGGGRNLQITLLVIFMSFYFITSLMSMIKDIPEEDFVRRKAQRMNNWKILWKVVVVDRRDYLVEVIRVNLSISLMMIVSVESMDKSQGGLGALLKDTDRAMAFPKIFALQLTILVLGIVLDYALRSLYNSYPSNKKST